MKSEILIISDLIGKTVIQFEPCLCGIEGLLTCSDGSQYILDTDPVSVGTFPVGEFRNVFPVVNRDGETVCYSIEVGDIPRPFFLPKCTVKQVREAGAEPDANVPLWGQPTAKDHGLAAAVVRARAAWGKALRDQNTAVSDDRIAHSQADAAEKRVNAAFDASRDAKLELNRAEAAFSGLVPRRDR